MPNAKIVNKSKAIVRRAMGKGMGKRKGGAKMPRTPKPRKVGRVY